MFQRVALEQGNEEETKLAEEIKGKQASKKPKAKESQAKKA